MNLQNDPQIEQVYVEPLMHCLEPVKSCSKGTNQRKLVINDVQCLAIANPNNHEVKVEFMVNFYVTNVNDENLSGSIIGGDGDGDDDDVTIMESHNQTIKQEKQEKQEQETKEKDENEKENEKIHDTKQIDTKDTKSIIFDATYSVFSIILRSGINS